MAPVTLATMVVPLASGAAAMAASSVMTTTGSNPVIKPEIRPVNLNRMLLERASMNAPNAVPTSNAKPVSPSGYDIMLLASMLEDERSTMSK